MNEKEKQDIIRKVTSLAEELLYDDEDLFYQILLDDGITVDVMKQVMGDETAQHMEYFCEEHGLI